MVLTLAFLQDTPDRLVNAASCAETCHITFIKMRCHDGTVLAATHNNAHLDLEGE
jgi:hypothetical protein